LRRSLRTTADHCVKVTHGELSVWVRKKYDTHDSVGTHSQIVAATSPDALEVTMFPAGVPEWRYSCRRR